MEKLIVILPLSIALVLWLMCIVDLANMRTENNTGRIAWLLVVLFMPFVGTLLYFFFGKIEPEDAVAKKRGRLRSEEEIKQAANNGRLI